MVRARAILAWAVFAAAVGVPLAIAAASPLMQWRSPVYIAACLAGVVAMALVLAQPLLARGYLPGLAARRGRRAHRWVGGTLVAAVALHVGGLWVTSPPDVVDALLFRAPTPFSAWGVVAMWVLFAAALLAAAHRQLGIRPRPWRLGHVTLAALAVVSSTVHALLIEGTMGMVSKAVLCALAVAATAKVAAELRPWTLLTRRQA